MELQTTIEALRRELAIVTNLIAGFEELAKTQQTTRNVPGAEPKRRGRKSMSPKERQEVSERMKRYWASRRKKKEQQGRSAAQ